MSAKSKLIGILPLLFLGISAFSVEVEVSADPNIEEAIKLGKNIEESIENSNPSYVNNLFDLEKFLNKTIPESQNSLEQAFYEGFTEEFVRSFDLGISIINEIGSEGDYTFLTAYSANNTYFLIFRMWSQQMINYHEYKLELCDDKFMVTDIYNYYSSSYISEILARVYKGGILYLTCRDQEHKQEIQSTQRINKTSELLAAGKYKKAMKEWYRIPANMRIEKHYLAEGLKISKFTDKEKFQEIYTQYMSAYPEEGGKYLIALEALTYQNRLKEALECLEKLDNFLHTDPVLDLIRANLYYELNDNSKAIEYLKEMIASKPDYEISYISLLGIYLEEKKYVDATLLLDQIVYTFNSYKEDLQPILVEYPEFLDSTEYTNWSKE